MNIKITRKVWLSAGITLALVTLTLLVSTAMAQEPVDGTELSPAGGSPTSTMSYQGYLEDGGGPANGVYDFRVSVWDQEMGGTLFGSIIVYDSPGVTVEDGIFTINFLPGVAVNQVFTGGPRWLQLEVRPHGVGGYTILPRQPITNVPYAWSLQPGAVISGTPTAWDGWVTKVNMGGAYPVASAILGTAATGSAVAGQSPGGNGTYGYTDDGYGVYGYDGGSLQARGYGGYFYSSNGVGVYGYSNGTRTHPNIYSPGVYGKSANGVGVYGRSDENTSSWTSAGVLGWGYANPGGKFFSYSGNLIEGWEDVAGNGLSLERRFRVSYSGEVYADGGYHCGKSSNCWYTSDPADFAEVLPTTNDPEPGDVLVIDPEGQLVPSNAPYQTAVVGVYSTRPMYLGGSENLGRDDYAPLAIVGIVPVKASAENGPIVPGDLLVTSATPGHAMKAGTDPAVGTVIGKALEPLSEDTGVIQMLVTLQ
jgi:hypothetical protein